MPRISVVIPTYNQADYLRDALKSVLAQTITDWEAIVVNNFSDDDTVAVAEGMNDPRIRVVNFNNRGVIAASRNKGISLASGEWIAFLDSDDLWTPDKLERCLAVAGLDVDVIGHPETIVRNGMVVGRTVTGTAALATYRSLLFRGNIFSPTAILVRRSLLDTVGGFAERPEFVTAEDYDLWLRLAAVAARARFVDAALSQYTLHEGQASASIDRHLKANLAVLDDHFGRLAPRRLFDRLRYRRAKSMIEYGAARSLQKGGQTRKAIHKFAVAIKMYPLQLRFFAGLVMMAVDVCKTRRGGQSQ